MYRFFLPVHPELAKALNGSWHTATLNDTGLPLGVQPRAIGLAVTVRAIIPARGVRPARGVSPNGVIPADGVNIPARGVTMDSDRPVVGVAYAWPHNIPIRVVLYCSSALANTAGDDWRLAMRFLYTQAMMCSPKSIINQINARTVTATLSPLTAIIFATGTLKSESQNSVKIVNLYASHFE